MKQERDSIDFGSMNIPALFVRLFIPTLLGLIFGAVLNLADGMFVGKGVGSDALAAVNIGAPVFLFCTGLSLMFGSGVSVVASIHMSHGNTKAANINVTQAFTVSFLIMSVLSVVVLLWPEATGCLFGGSDKLIPLVVKYLQGVVPGLPGMLLMIIGLFVIRLDGSPTIAMLIQGAASLLNIFLDWLFVYPLQWGIYGAAWATSISEWVGGLLVVGYMLFFTKRIHFYMPKFSRTALRLTSRNIGYMGKLGLSTFISEVGISVMMVVGNYMFMNEMQEDGVAAFCIVCYLFPLVLMFGNAIAQSALPIVSYNHGRGNRERVQSAFRLSVVAALLGGLLISAMVVVCAPLLVSVFLRSSEPAWQIAVDGLPYYATGVTFFTLNIVLIGYEQSREWARRAIGHMLLRGLVLVVPIFVLLPGLIGRVGLWLAVPFSELLTTLIIVLQIARNKQR